MNRDYVNRIETLEAALQEILEILKGNHEYDWTDILDDIEAVARKALNGEPPDDTA
jgi:hypothetical protein